MALDLERETRAGTLLRRGDGTEGPVHASGDVLVPRPLHQPRWQEEKLAFLEIGRKALDITVARSDNSVMHDWSDDTHDVFDLLQGALLPVRTGADAD